MTDNRRLLLWLAVACFAGACLVRLCRGADVDLGGTIDTATWTEYSPGDWYATWGGTTSAPPADTYNPTAEANLIAHWLATNNVNDTGAYIHDCNPTVGADNFATQSTASTTGLVENGWLFLDGATGGNGDHVYTTNSVLLNGNAAMSCGGWFYIDEASPYYCGLICSRGTYLQGLTSYNTSDKVYGYINTTAAGYTHASALDGEWHHYWQVYDGTNILIYLDGVLVKTQAKTGSVSVSDAWKIGYDDFNTSRTLLGIAADVRLYDIAISSAQVAAVTGEYSPIPTDNTYNVYYTFDQDYVGLSGDRVINDGGGAWATLGTTGTGASQPTWVDSDGTNSAHASFDDTDDYITTHYPPDWGSNQAVTVSAWVWTDGGGGYIAGGVDDGAPSDKTISFNCSSSEKLQFRIEDEDGNDFANYTTIAAIPTGTWVHAVGQFDPDDSEIRVYTNAVLAKTRTGVNFTANIYSSTNSKPFDVGTKRYNALHLDPWDGLLDEVIIDDTAWTAETITNYYNATSGAH